MVGTASKMNFSSLVKVAFASKLHFTPAEKKAIKAIGKTPNAEKALADALKLSAQRAEAKENGHKTSPSNAFGRVSDASKTFTALDFAEKGLAELGNGGWEISGMAPLMRDHLVAAINGLTFMKDYALTVQALATTVWAYTNVLQNMHAKATAAEISEARSVLDALGVSYDESKRSVDWMKKS